MYFNIQTVFYMYVCVTIQNETISTWTENIFENPIHMDHLNILSLKSGNTDIHISHFIVLDSFVCPFIRKLLDKLHTVEYKSLNCQYAVRIISVNTNIRKIFQTDYSLNVINDLGQCDTKLRMEKHRSYDCHWVTCVLYLALNKIDKEWVIETEITESKICNNHYFTVIT